jgi:parvulin-like peptidyl-prolyl isomerase
MEVQMHLSARILTAAAGLLLLAGPLVAQAPENKIAATVNGEAIGEHEVKAVLDFSMSKATQPVPAGQLKERRALAINMLVEDMLMRQYLRKNAPPTTPAAVDKEMQDLVADLAKEKKTLAEFLKETNQTEQQLRVDMAARLQWKAFTNKELSDEKVKQYYDANKVFFDKVLVRTSHVLLKVPENASQADKQMIFNRLQDIRKDILAGKIKFEDAASRYSDCSSKNNGGDIGLIPFKFLVFEPFARAAFAMKVGEVSDVVVTEAGYHLIKVTDRTSGQPSNFEAIKNDVKETYSQEIYQAIILEQRRTAKIEIMP